MRRWNDEKRDGKRREIMAPNCFGSLALQWRTFGDSSIVDDVKVMKEMELVLFGESNACLKDERSKKKK